MTKNKILFELTNGCCEIPSYHLSEVSAAGMLSTCLQTSVNELTHCVLIGQLVSLETALTTLVWAM